MSTGYLGSADVAIVGAGLMGCAAAYYPETNVLVPIRDVAEGSNQPVSKSIVITIEPIAENGLVRPLV